MKNNLRTLLAALALVTGLCLTKGALAENGGIGNLTNPLPAGVIYPTPAGILYPGFNIAAGVNAAALATGKRSTAGQLTVAPPLQSGDATSYVASVATSTNRLGWSIGYLGSQGDEMTHGLFAGVGCILAPISFGVGLRDTDISGGFDPDVDFGTRVELGKDFSLGAVVYNLNADPGVSAGIGFGRKKKENIEVNFLLPSLGGTDYAATFAATVYSGRFGTTFRTTYFITSQTFSHTLGGLIWFTSSINMFVQLTSPRTLGAGLTYVF